MVKKKIRKILSDTNRLIKLAGDAEEGYQAHNRKAAKSALQKIIKLNLSELREVNRIFQEIKYDDSDVIKILQELNKECNNVLTMSHILLDDLDKSKFTSQKHKDQVVQLFENIKKIEKEQEKMEEQFYGLKAVQFEEVMDSTKVSKMPKRKTLQQIRDAQNLFKQIEQMSELQKAKKLEEIVHKVGTAKAEKYFNRIFFFLRQSDKIVGRLKKANPDNELVNATETIQYSEVEPNENLGRRYKLPYPKEGLPRASDLSFLVTNGMAFLIFTTTIVGGMWTSLFAALGTGYGGIAAMGVVMLISFWFIKQRAVRYPKLSKKAINFIAFVQQGGKLADVYDSGKLLPAPKEVSV